MTGYISGFQSLGTVDGPGVRAVVFAAGCPLRCGYCHNPETWAERGRPVTEEELFKKITRLKPYIKDGGVTFSGGEPLLQAEFFASLAEKLKKEGLNIALDTSGCYGDEHTDKLLSAVDIVLLDIKFTTEEDYLRFTGGSLKKALGFLDKAAKKGKRIIIRQVITEGLNDGEEDIKRLKRLLSPYKIEKTEFLPFKKLCLEKYENLGIKFPFAEYEETSDETIERVYKIYSER